MQMKKVSRILLTLSVTLCLTTPLQAYAEEDAAQLFKQHCASCHGIDRLGGTGPALLPENLERLRKPEAIKTISEGRVATQMAAFSKILSPAQIDSLLKLIYTPLPQAPNWDEAAIRASRIEHFKPGSLPDQPVFKADMLNLFVVVEVGDHHATILDGDKFEPIHRFQTRFALHGGPKFSPEGRYVYFASRDGWISKFDIYNLKTVAEIRAGINTRNLAVSSDGRYVMVANYLPHTLVALDARDLSLIRVIKAVDAEGKNSSRVSAVYYAAPRKSFVAAFKDIPEVWEMSYEDNAQPVYEGLVHDYNLKEGIEVKGPFAPRRSKLTDYLDDFFFDPTYEHIMGASRDGKGQVVNLDARRKIADLTLPGMPHLGSGISWEWQGKQVMATPNLKDGLVTVIDMQNWQVIKQIKTPGPGFFMRSHENTRYAWTDTFNAQVKDTLQLIDKNTLEVAATLCPSPGKIAAHTEFTRDGKYALVSVWDKDGALVIYDADTLREIKRLPMNKPSGKYNVYNKITRSTGTSH